MALPNLFSRRQRQSDLVGKDEVYRYDELPSKLRVQILHIWDDAIGWDHHSNRIGHEAADYLVELMRKELGRFGLTRNYQHQSRREELRLWFMEEPELSACLDAVEVGFRIIDSIVRKNGYEMNSYIDSDPDDAIAELNARFKEAGVGYQFEGGDLIRIDSQYVHAEVVKPALSLLQDSAFEAANMEFREAHRLYRHGDNEQALTECCKAFESTLKVIAAQRAWSVPEHAAAKTLLDAAFTNGLIPEYLKGEFTALRALLESGVPTVRNRSSGHGAGTTPRSIPNHLAAFQIHQTAAAILLLVESHKSGS